MNIKLVKDTISNSEIDDFVKIPNPGYVPYFTEKEEMVSNDYQIGDFAFEDNDAEPVLAQNGNVTVVGTTTFIGPIISTGSRTSTGDSTFIGKGKIFKHVG